jgi:PAS domain S-box-containing protein
MKRSPRRQNTVLQVIVVVGVVGVLLLDLLTPLGIVAWILYLVPLSVSLYLWRPATPILVATAGTIGVIIGYFISPPPLQIYSRGIYLLNRAMGAVALWAVAAGARQFILSRRALLARQEELSQSEERFRLLVERVQDYAILMLDHDGRITTWNLGAERLKGYTAEEIIGKHFSVFYPPEAIQTGHPQRELEMAVQEGRYAEQGPRVRKDGTRFWADVTITPIKDESGNLRGFSKITRDLTERRIAEEALRESEERLRLMVEGVQDYAIFMLDPEGCVKTWNVGAERLKGYKAEEIIGQHFSIFYPEEAIQSGHPAHELELAIQEGRYSEEGWRLRKDGTRFWASVVITALRDASGVLRGFGKVTRDMTERKQAEDEVLRMSAELEQRVRDRTAALEAVNSELESFSYSVSHDLRTPLRGVDGFSKILLQKYGASLDEQGRHYLERIRAGTQRMGKLIDDLLRLSKITQTELKRVPLDLGALARDISEELRKTDPNRGVEFVIAEPAPIIGDPHLLRIALENLLGNAWKFTGKTEHARIELGAAPREGQQAFYVRDNGAGFEMEHASKLFAPFQRLHDATEFEGTGIGLATARRIIIRHGGRIWAEGKPNEGATFWFTLGGGAAAAP